MTLTIHHFCTFCHSLHYIGMFYSAAILKGHLDTKWPAAPRGVVLLLLSAALL
jgi:hypothetical protein